MEKQWCYFMFLLWLTYLLVAGVLMFTRGFLLTRVTQKEYSSCVPHLDIPCAPYGASSVNITNGHAYQCSEQDKLLSLLRDVNSASKVCLPQRANVILIIIDALKYDFAAFNNSVTNANAYQNKLTIIEELLKGSPERSRLYKFIADPPTTTMQRLKGLTTGSLPTFIDAGSNFATYEINEDNIIDQMIKNNKTVVFMGDDTWNGLFPNRFARSYPYPSFNVWDLDTVDNGIRKHLIPEILKPDWDLLIAHFLGVDHAGHRYGPFHPEMSRKLLEMNAVIESIVKIMDENTILLVIGDHGMTNTGDHGGDSPAEVTAAMFIHSAKPLMDSDLTANGSVVKQVDFVPTLSSLLGIPTPFSNLGSIILDSLPVLNQNTVPLNDWQFLLIALWINIQQTTDYVKQYSQTIGQLNVDKLEAVNSKYKILRTKTQNVKNRESFKKFAVEAREYIAFVRKMCEDVWVQFDSFSMSRGLLLMFLTIFFAYMIIDGIPSNRLPEIFMSSFLVCSYGVMLITFIGSVICYYLSLVENLELTIFFSTGMASVFMLAMLVIQNWEIIAIHWYDCTKRRDWLGISCRIVLLLSVSGLFSNSYILEEGLVLSFLLLTVIWLLVYNVGHKEILNSKHKGYEKHVIGWFKSQWTSAKIKLIVLGVIASILVRSSQYYWQCREEQSEWCETSAHKMQSRVSARFDCILALVSMALFATITRIWLRSCGNLVGFSPSVMVARYMPTVIVVCTSAFWVLHRLPKETKNKIIAPWQADVFSLVTYAIVILALVCIFIQPLCVYIISPKKETASVYGQENIIPQLFNQVKGMFDSNGSAAGHNKNMPVVCGLGTVYSAIFVVLSVFVLLLVALLLGDVLAPSAVIMYATAAVVLAILSIARYEKASDIVQLFEVSGTALLCWVLMSQYFFYGTGHQPAFPNIHWNAAFVGTGGNFVNNIIPAILVGINTFGSHILFSLTLPLLLIAPFTLYVMFPNLATLKSDQRKEMKRGELMLYERDSLLLSEMFTVSCKYILFHAIRIFVCMLAATIHCRHLMVFNIFAPKLIFEGLSLFITMPCVLVGYLLLVRTNYRVDRLVVGLEKQSR